MNSIILKPTNNSKTAIAQDLDTAEEPVNTIALESIRLGLRDVAFEHALSIRQLAQTAVEQALRIGTRLWRMKLALKRKEYAAFLRFLGWSTTKARKYINLAKTFDCFEITQLTRIELTTLLSLCSKRYQEVVATLREMPDISQELVEQLMKSMRVAAPKQSPISGDLLLSAKTWEEVELIVGCDRDYLLKAVKTWTIEERQLLVKLLSDYLTREPEQLNTVSWVSKNLSEKALSKLSFTLQRIGGPDNLADEPTIEYVHGCCFVSLQKFGNKYQGYFILKSCVLRVNEHSR